jgi:hypothetical protein
LCLRGMLDDILELVEAFEYCSKASI